MSKMDKVVKEQIKDLIKYGIKIKPDQVNYVEGCFRLAYLCGAAAELKKAIKIIVGQK